MTYFTSPKVNDWQKQVILGTVLGGSSIVKPSKGKNCYLFMRSRNKNWLTYKAKELDDLASQHPFTNEGNTTRWHSNCFPVFNEFRELFYVNGKKTVNMDILDQLRDIGLAVWFGDCGKLKNNQIVLNTHKFAEKGSTLVATYFNEVGIECDLLVERKNYRVMMSENGTKAFLATAGHRLPEFVISENFDGADAE